MESQSQRPPRMSRGKLVVSVSALLVSALIFVGIPLGEKYRRSHTVDKGCTLISAEVLNSRSDMYWV